jgi:hypothetical protein
VHVLLFHVPRCLELAPPLNTFSKGWQSKSLA